MQSNPAGLTSHPMFNDTVIVIQRCLLFSMVQIGPNSKLPFKAHGKKTTKEKKIPSFPSGNIILFFMEKLQFFRNFFSNPALLPGFGQWLNNCMFGSTSLPNTQPQGSDLEDFLWHPLNEQIPLQYLDPLEPNFSFCWVNLQFLGILQVHHKSSKEYIWGWQTGSTRFTARFAIAGLPRVPNFRAGVHFPSHGFGKSCSRNLCMETFGWIRETFRGWWRMDGRGADAIIEKWRVKKNKQGLVAQLSGNLATLQPCSSASLAPAHSGGW